jgi:serine/threonine protein kinase
MFMPPLIQKIEPGDVIGRCRTIRELGRGGVGTVFLATHQTLQIEVALKILSPALSIDNPALAERFIREAQLAARIRHPNVIAVMDAAHDEATGLYYIVMEYVSGGSLAWHLRNGPLPEKKAYAIITGIAHALAIAEENRIVHRDIKPENILLDPRGTAKLADLGLAKHALDSRTSLTLGGSYMGTPAYMSPEQARDAKVADTRDDIYSLGASFYESLTGQPPFQGETPYNIMSELLTKPSPKPRDLRPDLSLSADLICRKMMAKDRDLRYPDAHALLADLQHAQTFGDAGLDRLDASSFDQDAFAAHQQEIKYGVETSSDGVYAEPDVPEEQPRVRLLPHPASMMRTPPPRAGNNVFGAAALLITLVVITTILIAWAGSQHSSAFLKKEWAALSGEPQQGQLQPEAKPVNEKTHPHPVKEHTASTKKPDEQPHATAPDNTPNVTAIAPTNAVTAITPPDAIPVAPPASPTDLTNAAPVAPALPIGPAAALPDTAFVARDIAEKSLAPAIVAPTGHAELLKVLGRHDENALTPSAWTFYFYDKGAAGHARIVTVSGGQVAKTGEDLVDFASPYSETSILAEDQIQKDSADALQVAQGLIPGVPISSSEFTLMQQKNSVPMWKVALWTKKPNGEERRLGEVTMLAQNGTVILNNLKQP